MLGLENLRKDLINTDLHLKSLIQDINKLEGCMEDLNDLNALGRQEIAKFRKSLGKLQLFVEEQPKVNERILLLHESKQFEDELLSCIAAFQKANTQCLLRIEKANRDRLLAGDYDNPLRHRTKKNKENLVKMSSNITDQLFSISRSLAETTQRSADTLGTLVNSSGVVDGTREELENTGQVIAQSGKLLAKYGRREQTDKFLVFLAFLFFLACVFYIIHKRLLS